MAIAGRFQLLCFTLLSFGVGCSAEKYCDYALGMKSGEITDAQINASSFFSANHLPSRSRLDTTKDGSFFGAWSSKINGPAEWIQVDFLLEIKVTRIATQGRSDDEQWVKTYSLKYGLKDASLFDYKNGMVFTGNTDRDTIVSNTLDPPMIARYVRLHPITYVNHISMRWELYGCGSDFCDYATLGMQSGAIADEKITASSEFSPSHKAARSRLFLLRQSSLLGAWTALENDINKWIQVDLGKTKTVTRIATQGRADMAQWVKTYTLQYGSSVAGLKDYKNGANFTGNTDQNTVVLNILNPPISARYIRLKPTSFKDFCSMRWELYGCIKDSCDRALGMQSGYIRDADIKASSSFDQRHSPARSRLGIIKYGTLMGSWTSLTNQTNEWIQVDLRAPSTVTQIAIQGRSDSPQWVKTFSLQYGSNETQLVDYRNGTKFLGNTDQNTVVKLKLDPPIIARYVRLKPKTYQNKISMRWELYGCLQDYCDKALGLQSGQITDAQITASSYHSSGHQPARSRLFTKTENNLFGAWLTRTNDVEWIQVEFVVPTTVTRVVTQGRAEITYGRQFVKTYSLQYSNGTHMLDYKNGHEFKGNFDPNTLVSNVLNPAIFTKVIRLFPKNYSVHKSMRWELYGGCSPECKAYTPLNQGNRSWSEPLGNASVQCDKTVQGWYRFVAPAGTQIATSCTSPRYCGTHATGWMNGTHPNTNDGTVSRQACFSWALGCCQWKKTIRVRNCGLFFVYELSDPPHCSMRYCGAQADVSVASRTISVVENAGSITVSLARSIGKAEFSQSYLSLIIKTVNMLAVSGGPTSDYTGISERALTLSPGQVGFNTSIAIINDDVCEQDEKFYFNVRTDMKGLTITNSTTYVTIVNDDYASIGFMETSQSVFEAAGFVTVCMYINGTFAVPLTVMLTTMNHTAKAHVDYVRMKEHKVVITPINSTMCVKVIIKDDNIAEYNKTFYVIMSTNDPAVIVRENNKTITILNDDKVDIEFEKTSYEVDERVGTLTVGVKMIGKSELNAVVSVSTVNESAYSGYDFAKISDQPLTFGPTLSSPTIKTINLRIKEEMLIERNETFKLKLTTKQNTVKLTQKREIEILIINNDKANISLTDTSQSVFEGAGYASVCMYKEGIAAVPLSVMLTTINHTAKAHVDYVRMKEHKVVIAPNEKRKCAKVIVKDNNIAEYNKTFYVIMSTNDPAVIVRENNKTITILNDDKVDIEFEKTSYEVDERVGTLTVGVKMIGKSELNAVVSVSTVNESAYSGYDFAKISDQPLTFGPTLSSPTIKTINLRIKEEMLIERNETFKLKLTTKQNTVKLTQKREIEILIINNDKANISLTDTSQSVFEGAGYASVCMYKEGIAAVPLSVMLTTMNHTAKAHVDYVRMEEHKVVIAPNEKRKCAKLIVKDNSIAEYNKTFYVIMTTNDPAVIVRENNETITILNDDKVFLTFEYARYSLLEDNEFIQMKVLCKGLKSMPIEYSLSTKNGSAISPSDFVHISNRELEFAPNETEKPFNVSVKKDSTLEHDEHMSVRLESLSPQFTVIQPHGQTILTIKNDDSVFVEFVESSYNFTESVTQQIVQMKMNGTTDIDVVLRISTTSRSAYSGIDFTGISDQIWTFKPTSSSPTIINVPLNITEEVLIERAEHFQLRMTTSQTAVYLERNVTEIHIKNNDKAFIGFIETSQSVNEGDCHVTVCMFKDGLAAVPLYVMLTTINNTANDHLEYDGLTDFPVTFAAHENKTCVNVTIKDNNITEYNKTFYIIMTTSDPAVIVRENEKNLTVTILNDDQVTVEFEENYRMIIEEDLEGGKINLMCLITEGIAVIPIDIDLHNNPDKMISTADHGADFALRKESLTFHPGIKRLNLTIDITRDGDVESAEVFSIKIISPNENCAVVGVNHNSIVKIKDGRDFAKYKVDKLVQDKTEKARKMMLKLVIAAATLLLVFAILGVILVICLIKK